jgi:hypothetical protein
MQLVPFDPAWVLGKLDLHAIYRRPNGDVTMGLPVRRHLDWIRKGLEWVTLADAESLQAVAPSLRAQGYSPASFVADPRTNSPWSYEAYVRAGYAPEPPVVEAPPATAVVPKAPVVRRKKRGRPKRTGPSPLAVSLGEPSA